MPGSKNTYVVIRWYLLAKVSRGGTASGLGKLGSCSQEYRSTASSRT
jgi:hypothetical protein